jgi:hypothetical protein
MAKTATSYGSLRPPDYSLDGAAQPSCCCRPPCGAWAVAGRQRPKARRHVGRLVLRRAWSPHGRGRAEHPKADDEPALLSYKQASVRCERDVCRLRQAAEYDRILESRREGGRRRGGDEHRHSESEDADDGAHKVFVGSWGRTPGVPGGGRSRSSTHVTAREAFSEDHRITAVQARPPNPHARLCRAADSLSRGELRRQQLINVVRGEISLLGPRPERPGFARVFQRDVYRYGERFRVKSGITGWAQVHGLRGQTSLADRVEWDNYYIESGAFGST